MSDGALRQRLGAATARRAEAFTPDAVGSRWDALLQRRLSLSPLAPKQNQCGGQVRRHEEREKEIVVLVDVPAQQARRDHAVAETGDWNSSAAPWISPSTAARE